LHVVEPDRIRREHGRHRSGALGDDVGIALVADDAEGVDTSMNVRDDPVAEVLA
jgi:hypothetical protein